MNNFILKCNPPITTSQEKKVAIVCGKPRFYEPKRLKEAKQLLINLLKEHTPQEKLEGALALYVTWKFPRNKSHKHNEWRITKPDTDNLQKMLKDCMTKTNYWNDDAQVVIERCCKVWVNNEDAGIEISIEQLDKFRKDEK
jgi:Holliday junction resolvase RusA-like endonuclease